MNSADVMTLHLLHSATGHMSQLKGQCSFFLYDVVSLHHGYVQHLACLNH